jgi:hypothetical protein
MYSHPETMFLLATEFQRSMLAEAERHHTARIMRRSRRAARRAARQAARLERAEPRTTAGTLAACAPAVASAR